MKSINAAIFVILSILSSKALAEVDLDSTEGEVVLVTERTARSYDREIQRLDQEANEITLKIGNHKGSDQSMDSADDGIRVTLVKVQR